MLTNLVIIVGTRVSSLQSRHAMPAKGKRKADELDRESLDRDQVKGMLGILAYRADTTRCKNQKLIDEAKHAFEVFDYIKYIHCVVHPARILHVQESLGLQDDSFIF